MEYQNFLEHFAEAVPVSVEDTERVEECWRLVEEKAGKLVVCGDYVLFYLYDCYLLIVLKSSSHLIANQGMVEQDSIVQLVLSL